jgi:lysophospholipase L1-like esterase
MIHSTAVAALLALCAPALAAQVEGRAAPLAEKVRVACVGDSITYGAAVDKRDENCYPAVLGRRLGGAYEVRNFGVSGATLLRKGDKPYWKEKAFAQAGDFTPNIVIIKLGTNDTKPQNWKFKSEFEADARALVQHFKTLPSKPKVFLALPVAVVKSSFGIVEEGILAEIPLLIKVAREEGAVLIDLHQAVASKDLFVGDGVHPNVAGAKKIADTIFNVLSAK